MKGGIWANKAIGLKDDFWAAINNKANIFHEKGDVLSSLELFRSLMIEIQATSKHVLIML
ncbi:MAG: hypothetical protein CM15mP98_10540 [Paracoccaceae bacterium]|nr:MAG: hypothetical protein CM15mP98_10540 [Paracoccaceae bacterium]